MSGVGTALAYIRDANSSAQPQALARQYRMKLHSSAGNNRQGLIDSKSSGDVYQTVHYYWGLPSADIVNIISDPRKGQVKEAARKDYCGHLTFTRLVDYHIEEQMKIRLQAELLPEGGRRDAGHGGGRSRAMEAEEGAGSGRIVAPRSKYAKIKGAYMALGSI